MQFRYALLIRIHTQFAAYQLSDCSAADRSASLERSKKKTTTRWLRGINSTTQNIMHYANFVVTWRSFPSLNKFIRRQFFLFVRFVRTLSLSNLHKFINRMYKIPNGTFYTALTSDWCRSNDNPNRCARIGHLHGENGEKRGYFQYFYWPNRDNCFVIIINSLNYSITEYFLLHRVLIQYQIFRIYEMNMRFWHGSRNMICYD